MKRPAIRWHLSFLGVVCLLACRGPAAQSPADQHLGALVDSLMPAVAKATGLAFKATPRSAVRSKDQIRAYVLAKMNDELPPERLEGIVAAYRLLGMLPDTLDLRQLFVDLYTEQIAGFYDPDSTTLFAVEGANPLELRLVLAHELVHALQDQYAPLDSILHDNHDGDRQAAAQAVLEGQATLASMTALLPNVDLVGDDAFWETFREQLRAQQFGTGVYARAPMVIREGLTFPYVAGAEFVRWFRKAHPGEEPFGRLMPVSTEQILDPRRLADSNAPVEVRFAGDTAGVMFEDTFGEFDLDLLRASVQQSEVRTAPPAGWGGDRLRVYRTPSGPALVWLLAWDAPIYAQRFQDQVLAPLMRAARPGYRMAVAAVPAAPTMMRLVLAPDSWAGWGALPGPK
jgi:hypothetical protein